MSDLKDKTSWRTALEEYQFILNVIDYETDKDALFSMELLCYLKDSMHEGTLSNTLAFYLMKSMIDYLRLRTKTSHKKYILGIVKGLYFTLDRVPSDSEKNLYYAEAKEISERFEAGEPDLKQMAEDISNLTLKIITTSGNNLF